MGIYSLYTRKNLDDRRVVSGKMLLGPEVGIGDCRSLVGDDLVVRACDWLLMTSVW